MIATIRPPRRWLLFGLAVAALAAMILTPLRFVTALVAKDDDSLTAKSVYGGFWNGGVRDLRIGILSFGDMKLRLSFLPMFIGNATFHIQNDIAAGKTGIAGSITKSWTGVSVNDLTGAANSLATKNALPISSVEFQDFSVRFAGGQCRNAGGSLRILLKTNAIPGTNTDGGFLGNAKCKGGALYVPMASQSAMERIDLTIQADGKYSLSIRLNTAEPQSATMLAAGGFQPIAGGYLLVINDRF